MSFIDKNPPLFPAEKSLKRRIPPLIELLVSITCQIGVLPFYSHKIIVRAPKLGGEILFSLSSFY